MWREVDEIDEEGLEAAADFYSSMYCGACCIGPYFGTVRLFSVDY
ncbi:hypothetical protein [Methylobacter sp. BlB1]|nr:hypothetical protein [Methylobacter sp. BlB1]